MHDHRRIAGELAHRVEEPRVLQRELLLERVHLPRAVVQLLLAALRDERRVQTALVHAHLGRVVDAEETEGDEEHMQQARVAGVLDVLEDQLPVRPQALARVAEQAQLAAVEYPVVKAEHLLAEISLKVRYLRIQRSKNSTAARGDADRRQPVLREI